MTNSKNTLKEDSSIVKIAYQAAEDKKAYEVIVLNMMGISSVADYFLICHGNSDKQVQAIAKEMRDQLTLQGHLIRRIEGFDEGKWVLIDAGDVVAHVFQKEDRYYYHLEKLWGDAPLVEVTLGEGK